MRWLAKAALQRALGFLPQQGEPVNYFLQRRVLHTLPAGEAGLRQKFARAVTHLAAYERHGAAPPAAEATFFEFGAGWDLAIPLAYALLGVGRQVVIDIRPSARLELVAATLATYERLRPQLEQTAGRALRDLPAAVSSFADLERELGVRYLAPCDARATGLAPGCVDFVSSTDTCEHIPPADLARIFAECRRLLRPGGAFSCRIDLQDHYAYFDPGLSRYHFLRFSDRAWALVNSPLHFQNRLRASDYLRLVREAGFEVVAQNASGPNERSMAELRTLRVAPRFRSYSLDDVGVTVLSFVAKPTGS
jgi:SAM-dependent methyltransferase